MCPKLTLSLGMSSDEVPPIILFFRTSDGVSKRNLLCDEVELRCGIRAMDCTGGSAAFEDIVPFTEFYTAVLDFASEHNITIQSIFRIRDPGLGLDINEEYIQMCQQQGLIWFPEGYVYQPLPPGLQPMVYALTHGTIIQGEGEPTEPHAQVVSWDGTPLKLVADDEAE